MTDKQIIIDGADVSNCKRRIGKDNFCRYYKRPCAENNYNCIWKKYLRKEQECEKLKKQLTLFMNGDYCKNGCSLKQQLDQLKQTLTEIKKILEIHKDNKCAICPKFDECFEHPSCDNIILQKISECEVEDEN